MLQFQFLNSDALIYSYKVYRQEQLVFLIRATYLDELNVR